MKLLFIICVFIVALSAAVIGFISGAWLSCAIAALLWLPVVFGLAALSMRLIDLALNVIAPR